MRVGEYVTELVRRRLDEKRIVVWYDSERTFHELATGFSAPGYEVVLVESSRLRGRRQADQVYRQIGVPDAPLRASTLLIYLPYRRQTGDDRLDDPFEVFAVAGDTFGDSEAEQLRSLAHQAMPELAEQIERLFAHGRPSLAVLDRLEQGAAYPLVKQALGTQSVSEVAAQLVADLSAATRLSEIPGAADEALRLLEDELGFVPAPEAAAETRWRKLGEYVLMSEFAFDFPGIMPDALANISHATDTYRAAIYATCERLRDTVSYHDAYIEMASRVERDFNLPAYFGGVTDFGARDTFAFEERGQLAELVKALTQGPAAAKAALAQRRDSIWRRQPDRAQIWRVAERCIDLLEVAERVEASWANDAGSVAAMIAAYTRPGGWSDLDAKQRLLEQSVAESTDCEDLEEVVARCRSRYRDVAGAIQRRFLDRIEQEGWPPEGMLHLTQVFDRLVAPALETREKVALLLVDSLRFEMGRDLVDVLASLGETALQPAAAALPTITPVGMAALLPGADAGLMLRQEGAELVPYLGERRVKNLEERKAFMVEKLGDRVLDIGIDDFLSLSSRERREARLRNADLVVVRDQRLDRMGETGSPREARKYITELLRDLKSVATHLVRLGYVYLVIAADHGHVFFPELGQGDVVAGKPLGTWGIEKRRVLVGHRISERPGQRVFSAAHLGLHGEATDLAVPNGFGVYEMGTGYFHGGISLQECVIPILTLRARQRPEEPGRYEVKILYRSDRFTSRVIGTKIWFNSLTTESVRARVEAYDSAKPSARKVGEGADCEARDEKTREIVLKGGAETPVPILLDQDFDGDQVEIRVTSSETPIIWARLTLKNAMLE